MSTDPSRQLLPLVKAVHQETGYRPHLSTVLRWCQVGRRGVLLESWLLGGRRMTTTDAVRAFVDRLTAESAPAQQLTAATSRQRERQIQAANRQLDAAGIGGGK